MLAVDYDYYPEEIVTLDLMISLIGDTLADQSIDVEVKSPDLAFPVKNQVLSKISLGAFSKIRLIGIGSPQIARYNDPLVYYQLIE